LRTALAESIDHLRPRSYRSHDARCIFRINLVQGICDIGCEGPGLLLGVVSGNDEVIIWICDLSPRLIFVRTISINIRVLRTTRCRVDDRLTVKRDKFGWDITRKFSVFLGANIKYSV
jgi:hypothetical protein